MLMETGMSGLDQHGDRLLHVLLLSASCFDIIMLSNVQCQFNMMGLQLGEKWTPEDGSYDTLLAFQCSVILWQGVDLQARKGINYILAKLSFKKKSKRGRKREIYFAQPSFC